MLLSFIHLVFFFFTDPAPTEIYTLSLHDALPIYCSRFGDTSDVDKAVRARKSNLHRRELGDRKSTRLNSSHVRISYAVFCLKKKKKNVANQLDPQEANGVRLGRPTTWRPSLGWTS